MDSRISFVPAQTKHVGRIARLMRDVDRREVEAMGHTPKQALRNGVFISEKVWTAMLDGQPEAMFGVVVNSALGGQATPWFLGTDEVYRHGRALLMWGGPFLEAMGNSTMTFRNLVSSENTRAIRLLKWWGFTIDETEIDVNGVLFREFRKEPERCVILQP